VAANSISSVERQRKILAALQQSERLSVADICKQFSVSEATARRDLEALTGQGRIRRVHGGAILPEQAPPELPILQRQDEEHEAKARIGRAAANLLSNDDTVFLGSGTTVLEVALQLRGRSGLTVFTNSLPVVNALAGAEEITLVSVGGLLRDSELSFIGNLAEQALGELRVDKVIIGIRAISLERGLTNDYMQETMTDRAILKVGGEVIVLADHTKCGVVSTAFVAPLSRIQRLVTDAATPRKFIAALRARGIAVTVASE
jgi:DeoR family transcriptional regulator of aga operon